MPMAIPLIAAYASISAGVAAAGFIGGMMIAGGVMTAVGTITGDKKLSKYGGLLSLAGGAAGLASGAWEGAAQSISAESTGVDYVNQMDMASDAASLGAESGAGAANAMADAATPSLSQTPAPYDDFGGVGGDVAANGAASQSAAQANSVAVRPDLQAATAAPGAPLEPTGQAGAAPSLPPTPSGPSSTVVPPPKDSTGGMLSWIGDPKNGRAVQAGSGLLSSVGNYYAQQDAVKEQLRLQEDARQRARDRLNASVKGLKMPTFQKG